MSFRYSPEGASAQKVPTSPGFLRDALAAFGGTCKTPAKKALFTLGHSLGPEDQHIVGLLPKWRIPTVYLGTHGDKEIGAFQDIAASRIAARAMAELPPLEVLERRGLGASTRGLSRPIDMVLGSDSLAYSY